MEQKLDRRVRRTREQLKRALTQLLLEKPVREITVRELTDRADVNRGTFYAHYTDLYDMLEQMENELLEAFQALLDRHAPDDLTRDLAPLLSDVFCFVEENRADAGFPGAADGGPLSPSVQPGDLPAVPAGVGGALSPGGCVGAQLLPGVRGVRHGEPGGDLGPAGLPRDAGGHGEAGGAADPAGSPVPVGRELTETISMGYDKSRRFFR